MRYPAIKTYAIKTGSLTAIAICILLLVFIISPAIAQQDTETPEPTSETTTMTAATTPLPTRPDTIQPRSNPAATLWAANDLEDAQIITYHDHPDTGSEFKEILGINMLWMTAQNAPLRRARMLIDLKTLDHVSWVLIPHIRWEVLENPGYPEAADDLASIIEAAKNTGKNVILKVGTDCLNAESSDNNWVNDPSRPPPSSEVDWINGQIDSIKKTSFDTSTDYILLGSEPNLPEKNCNATDYAQKVSTIIRDNPSIKFGIAGLSPNGQSPADYLETILETLKDKGTLSKLKAIGFNSYDGNEEAGWQMVDVKFAKGKFEGDLSNTVLIGDEVGYHHCGEGKTEEAQYKGLLNYLQEITPENTDIIAINLWVPFDDGGHLQEPCGGSEDMDSYSLYAEPLLYDVPYLTERKAMTLLYTKGTDRNDFDTDASDEDILDDVTENLTEEEANTAATVIANSTIAGGGLTIAATATLLAGISVAALMAFLMVIIK